MIEPLHQFIKALPKLELHAHLNGSIREHTLIELATERNVQLPQSLIQHDAVEQQQKKEDDGRSIPLFLNTRPRSLQDCFKVFEYIPHCVNDLVALRRITEEVLCDAAADGIAYIELRTGPKCLLRQYYCDRAEGVQSSMATKREYVQTIIDIMQEFEKKESLRYTEEMKSNHNHRCDNNKIVRLPLIPRLIISVDRSGTVAQADENINLAIELFQQQQQSSQKGDAQNNYIVGVELGGNPTKNDFTNFEASFERARKAGLRVAIHIGEIPMASSNQHHDESHSSTSSPAHQKTAGAAAAVDPTLLAKYKEALAVINFRPDRLGHALTLSPSLIELLYNDPIPIECCPTSNTMTLDFALHHEGSLIDGMTMHPHLKKWIDTGYPISINTDDSGIFCTDLTKEFLLIAKVFGLDEKRLSKIILDSVDHVFDEDIKDRLRSDIQSVVGEMI